MKKQWKGILSMVLCIVLLLSWSPDLIALTTEWDILPPELEEKLLNTRLEAEVKAVIQKIAAIGEVTYDDSSLSKIQEAESAYSLLSAAQKEQVSNYGALLTSRNTYNVLEADHEDTSGLIITDSGTINSTVSWYVYSNGLLEIAGEGTVPSYTGSRAPWYGYAGSIQRILVRSSITGIGAYAFSGCSNVTEITLPFVGASRSATGETGHFGYIFGGTKQSDDLWDTYQTGYYTKHHYAYFYRSDEVTSGSNYYYNYYYYWDFAIPSKLTTVTITDATRLSDCAFKNCTNLSIVRLNDGISSLGSWAFYGDTALTGFTIPKTVTTLGEYCFWNCSGLTEIFIPNAVTAIPSYAFSGCSGSRTLVLGENTVTIGNSAFAGNSALTKLTIPQTVTSIGTYAFSNCSRIPEINIPDSVVTIGESAFAYNTNASALRIGSGLKTVPAYAFQGNTSLKKIVVPDTVTKIEGYAFYDCSNITEITLPFVGASRSATGETGHFGYIFGGTKQSDYTFSSNKSGDYHSKYHYAYYYSVDSGSPNYDYYYYWDFAIPSKLTTVTITDATRLSDCAFKNCTNITSLSLNDELNTVGTWVFSNVPWYTAQSKEFVVVGDGVLIKYNGTASGITIPDDVTYIGGSVFQSNRTISEVILHDEVSGIGQEAFDGCTNLTSLTIPKSVTTIGTDAIPSACKLYVYRPSAGYDYRSTNREVLNDSYTTGNDTYYYVANEDGSVEIIGCKTTSTELTVPVKINGMVVSKIGDYGFADCVTLNSITIPSNITSIGQYAFSGCTGLVNATIPTTVKSVGDYAFFNCTGLVNVTISEGVERIGKGAFYNCTSLVEAVIPDTAVSVGSHAFYNCTSMTTATIGISAEAINEYAFYNCENLDTVVIGISTKSIGDYAFYNCALARVSVPATVTSIGAYAFASNDTMTRATLRKNLLTIGEGAFRNCSALATVAIPTSVTEIGKAAFENCTSITTITVPASVTVVNDFVFSGCEKLATVKLNGSVTSIGVSAFFNCGFETIALPETVEEIGTSAFRKCINLLEITIPDSTKSIGDSAFINCSALTTVSLPDDVTNVGNGVFFYNNDLTVEIRGLTGTIADGLLEKQGVCHVLIDETISTIGSRAFAHCYALSDITYGEEAPVAGNYLFSKQVTSIGAEAFVDNELLKNLIIPDSIQSIGADTVYHPILTEYHCKDVTATFYYVNGSIAEDILNGQDYSHIVVNDNIHTLGNSAFSNCDQLMTVSLPDTITTVGTDVFASSSGKLTATIRGVDGTIDSSVYDGKMTDVLYVVIDEAVDTIGSYAFANSDTIEGVVIHDTALVADHAFYKGIAIDYVEIGAANKIDDYAFAGCISIKNFYIDGEAGLEHIGDHAFEECKLIPEMILPETVRHIGAYAFYNCNSMASINIPEGVPAIHDNTFFGCASLEELLLPDSVLTIGDWAFYGCVAVKNMSLGNQTTAIGEYAFYNCNQISALTLPETVTEIGDYAFRSCSRITEIHIPDSVVSLGDCAFYSCTGLEQIEFGTGITVIGDRVFYACVELDKVVFNSPVEEIHDLAFYGAEDATLCAFDDEYVETYCNDFGLIYYNLSSAFTMSITSPDKTEYLEYEELDLTGLTLHLTYENGSERTIKTGYAVSGYDPGALGTQTITVTYKEECATFDIFVAARDISFIAIVSGAPVDVIAGEELDCSSMVIRVTFADGATVDLTDGYTVTNYDPDTLGEQTLSVSYRGCSQNFNVTVNENAEPLFSSFVSRMILGNALDLQFGVSKAAMEDWTGVYAKVTMQGSTEIIPYEDWSSADQYYSIASVEVAAKEMTEDITVQIFNREDQAVSLAFTDSVCAYVERAYEKYSDNKSRTMFVDMLNYGAAAQEYFSYNVENLANANLTQEQLSYATEDVTMSDCQKTEGDVVGITLDLGSRILIKVGVKGVDKTGYATYSYTDHYGKLKKGRIEGSEFGNLGGVTAINMDMQVLADARQPFTLEVFSAEGDRVAYVYDSMEAYIHRALVKYENDLFVAIMKFATSAYHFFH